MGGGATLPDERALLLGGDEPRHRRATERRAGDGVDAGAAGGAFHEDALPGPHARDVVERLVDRLEIQHERRAFGQREPLRVREELRRLAPYELREAAVGRLVALDLEVGVHGIVARARRQEVRHAGIEHAELADLEPPLARGLAAQRGHEDDGATARHVHVLIVHVEDRHGNATRGEDRVVGEAGVEHIAEDVVGAERGHRHLHAPQGLYRLSVRGAAPLILHHRPRLVVRRQRVEPGPERSAERQDHVVHRRPGLKSLNSVTLNSTSILGPPAATLSIASLPARCPASLARASNASGVTVPEYCTFWLFSAIQ